MIEIDRSAVRAPSSITGSGEAGDRERIRAINHYALKSKKKFSFLAYKEKDVVEALKVLFNGKCAYCECKILAVGPPDIEHFRPKGKVAEDGKHPGYWWLASKWENLHLCCRDCNSSRYHIVLSEVNGTIVGIEKLAGKHCSFPVQGRFRAKVNTDNHLNEDALLIDPTARNPANHLTWSLEHSSALAVPRTSNNVTDIYGEASVKGYALNRSELVQARIDHANNLRYDIIHIKFQIANIASVQPPTDPRPFIETLKSMVDTLLKKSEPNRYLSAFSQYVIHEGLRDVQAELRNLFATL